jgi:hypothetical protein
LAGTWTDAEWATLLDRIEHGNVTPVLGAGASASVLGTGADLAKAWAGDIGYHAIESDGNLAAVAQYVATTGDRASPGEWLNERFSKELENFTVADLESEHDPYLFLPKHKFPMWLTTNYDDLIQRALNARGKVAHIGCSKWQPPDVFWDRAAYDLTGFEPTDKDPLVFYVHGRYEDATSMVVTEADYLLFLEQMASLADVLPPVVESAIASTSLLFIGYSMRDINLQLLLRRWQINRVAYAIRPAPPNIGADDLATYADFYPKYLKEVTGVSFKIFWGTGTEFCKELDEKFGAAP